MVYVVEHDFSNAHIQEHLHLAFDNVPILKVESTSTDKSSRKQSKKRKPAKKGEQVGLSSFKRSIAVPTVAQHTKSPRLHSV